MKEFSKFVIESDDLKKSVVIGLLKETTLKFDMALVGPEAQARNGDFCVGLLIGMTIMVDSVYIPEKIKDIKTVDIILGSLAQIIAAHPEIGKVFVVPKETH